MLHLTLTCYMTFESEWYRKQGWKQRDFAIETGFLRLTLGAGSEGKGGGWTGKDPQERGRCGRGRGGSNNVNNGGTNTFVMGQESAWTKTNMN